jgi:Clostripain family
MTDPKAEGKARWTVMVYMAAQNLLTNFAFESLKRLKSGAGDGIVVAAQLHADINQKVRRYLFADPKLHEAAGELETIDVGEGTPLRGPNHDMRSAQTLTEFLNWVADSPKCAAERYCLVLWSEGPFFEDTRVVKGKKRTSQLMPADLEKALSKAKLKSRQLQLIVMDACCDGMLEIAVELRDCAPFMIASQEEVPDLSFPYSSILHHFRNLNDLPEICAAVTKDYEAAYCRYISNQDTEMRKVTLSGLQLKETSTITRPLKDLSRALLSAAADEKLSKAIINARANTKDFSAGLYVDLYDFCEQLKKSKELRAVKSLTAACDGIVKAIGTPDKSRFVVANRASREERCHGISLYMPYVTNADEEEWKRARGEQLVKGGLDVPLKLRINRFETIEREYGSLQLSKDTKWNEFIAHGWSRCLAAQAKIEASSSGISDELDRRYSAEQCALNLLSSC